ncbi:unnamed protein product [Macrosiphum euphorbiae]|uniref:MULE transposase domain-containing protein n=1 Tax=Macrosiphum euphorbiae TaxID=13131 RepID=A0AAV0WTW5_9HEMI|nr:unnamed protein product [Macrosiphum euphorbiae]
MEVILSERGKELILYKNYKFSCKNLTKNGRKWRCTEKTCNAKLYVDEVKTTILKEETEHNHLPPKNVQRQIISNQVKRKAMDDLIEKPLKLINKQIFTEKSTNDLKIEDISIIRQNLYRARRKSIPKLPKNLRETQEIIMSTTTLTNRNEEYLLINDFENNITAFSTVTNLKFICYQEKIFMDGTFSYCPKYFYQLFTIHTVNNLHYIPLIFFLLPSKESIVYERALKALIDICESKLSIKFNPKVCVVDFEKSLHNDIITVWPTIILHGCRFHLSQAWWRKIQNLGLTSEYKNDLSEIGQWLRWIFGLSLLEPENVLNLFANDFMSIKSTDERVTQFSDYLINMYIDEGATFPPFMWASCSISSERTTNACESFHSAFGKYFYSAHPNIFVFLEVLKLIQVQIYIKINSIQKENKIQNSKYKKQKTNIDDHISRYKYINMFQFVKSVSHHYKK